MKASIYQVTIPMRRSFGHAEFNRKAAESVILEINYNGVAGCGECAPRKYVTGETVDSVLRTVTDINFAQLFYMLDFSSLELAVKSLKKLEQLYKLNQNEICLLEMALLDLMGRLFKCSVADILRKYYLSDNYKNNVDAKLHETTQVMDLSLTPKEFLKKRAPFHCVKIKVGKNLDENVKRVGNIRNYINSSIPIVVDANMAWNLGEALINAAALSSFGINYYEEPLAKGDLENYRKLRERSDVKIMLDESLCSVADGIEAVNAKACDAFNIRISKCGGITKSVELARLANKHSISYQIGAQVAEAGPLIAAGRQLISVLNDNFAFEAGQPDRLFAEVDYIVDPMPLVDRSTNLAAEISGYGLGVDLNNTSKRFAQQKFNWRDGQWQAA